MEQETKQTESNKICQHDTYVPCENGICTSDVHTHHCNECGAHANFPEQNPGLCLSCEA